MTVTVIAAGGRDYEDRRRAFRVFEYAVERLGMTRLVEGGCPTGLDLFAREWREENCFDGKSYEANWTRYGNGAGPKRNQEMLDAEAPAFHLSFPGNKGTWNMRSRALRAGMVLLNNDPHVLLYGYR